MGGLDDDQIAVQPLWWVQQGLYGQMGAGIGRAVHGQQGGHPLLPHVGLLQHGAIQPDFGAHPLGRLGDGRGRGRLPSVTLASAPIDVAPIVRAAFVAGDRWVTQHDEPPASRLLDAARPGEIDPVFGRDREIRQMIDIFARRRKNNPILVGDPGVGKTAMAEGLALRIHEGRVPDDLTRAEIFSLDIGSLLAGTRYRGDFEERLKAVVSELEDHLDDILSINEIHTVIGAGATSGGASASAWCKSSSACSTEIEGV